MTLNSKTREITDVAKMKFIPSISTCNHMLNNIRKGFSAITTKLGTFNESSLNIILKIHRLKEISKTTQEQLSWVEKQIRPPNETCRVNEALMSCFKQLISDIPDGRYVFEYDRTLLSSDLATLAGSTWLNYSIHRLPFPNKDRIL